MVPPKQMRKDNKNEKLNILNDSDYSRILKLTKSKNSEIRERIADDHRRKVILDKANNIHFYDIASQDSSSILYRSRANNQLPKILTTDTGGSFILDKTPSGLTSKHNDTSNMSSTQALSRKKNFRSASEIDLSSSLGRSKTLDSKLQLSEM